MDYWSLFVAFMGSDMEKFNGNSPLVAESPDKYISASFSWSDSTEGRDFWYNKSNQWKELIQNPTKLHKLLAGIE